MAIRRALTALLLAGLAGAATAQLDPNPGEGESCTTLDHCLERIRAPDSRVMSVGSTVERDILPFGDAAVDALVPMLLDPDMRIRERAGLVLAQFERIDRRHLPALAHAWRHGDTINRAGRGNGWLPRAIAATGTEEALSLLWEDLLRDPEHGSNAQTFFALARFGERLQPLVRPPLAACAQEWTATCDGIVSLFYELDRRFPPPRPPVMPEWAVAELVTLSQAPSPDAQSVAAYNLGRLLHPAAIAPLQRELAALSVAPSDGEQAWAAQQLIRQLAQYGPSASVAGPVIARYLDRGFGEDLPAAAALALGQVEDASFIPQLLALAPELTDDWVLAYNVTESLGRLRASGARPLLERLAADHWHRGVRNNAQRALNFIAGGAFVRPGEPGDGRPYMLGSDDDGTEYLYTGDLRFAGDEASDRCEFADEERARLLGQNPVARIRWPRTGNVEVEMEPVGAAVSQAVRRRIPVDQVQGRIVAVLPVGSGLLVAFNGGEFGGGLYHLPDHGQARELTAEPVQAAWLMNERLFVADGLAHIVIDRGRLLVIDPRTLVIERTIRLPGVPIGLQISSRRVVTLRTREGDIAVRDDGTILDAARAGGCEEE